MFAHAGVRLDAAAADAGVQELRRLIRSPATEYKANHVLREKHRPVLLWLLGDSGPLAGNGHVYLVDKAYLLVDRLVALLADAPHEGAARRLYCDGGRRYGAERWQSFLLTANAVLRARDRLDTVDGEPVGAFFRLVHAMRDTPAPDSGGDVVGELADARHRVTAYRERLLDEPDAVPALDPLVPAVVRAVQYWSGDGDRVTVVHDRQNLLSAARVAELHRLAGDRFAGLRLVEARVDARVQLADCLAGVTRKIASDELNGRGDAELTALVRQYVDADSLWADRASATALGLADLGRDLRR